MDKFIGIIERLQSSKTIALEDIRSFTDIVENSLSMAVDSLETARTREAMIFSEFLDKHSERKITITEFLKTMKVTKDVKAVFRDFVNEVKK